MNLFEKAEKKDKSILSDPNVSKVKDHQNRTPLHILAKKGVKECLSHPDVSKVKDVFGWTPLHWLAHWKVMECFDHPDVNKIKNNKGNTPLDFYIQDTGQVPRQFKKTKYEIMNLP